jgi:hypothetical protein
VVLVRQRLTSRNGKNRTPSSKCRGAISNGFSGRAANEAEEKSYQIKPAAGKKAL